MSAIELTGPRVIVVTDHGKQYKLTIDRIPKSRWITYFSGIVSTSENDNGKRLDMFDSRTARLQLVEDSLIDADGYTTDGPVTSIENWKQKLPLSHRLGVADVLISVQPSTAAQDVGIILGQENVFLDAIWDANDKGEMQKYTGLRHSFQTPTSEHQRIYSRASSRSRIIGGTRTGKTMWLGAQPELIKLYDELILDVEGYLVGGAKPSRDSIIENMDAYHKVSAAEQLFSPADVKVSEE